jgi:hypothetical protein
MNDIALPRPSWMRDLGPLRAVDGVKWPSQRTRHDAHFNVGRHQPIYPPFLRIATERNLLPSHALEALTHM